MQFDVRSSAPVGVEITEGNASEIAALKASLQAGRLYVLDRGCRDFDLMEKIVEADSSFVIRLHENVVFETIQEYALTEEAKAAKNN